jgi:hypothetical protein
MSGRGEMKRELGGRLTQDILRDQWRYAGSPDRPVTVPLIAVDDGEGPFSQVVRTLVKKGLLGSAVFVSV